MGMDNATHFETRDTLIPASYPELGSEILYSLDSVDERETEIPPPSVQLTLELECLGLEQW